MLNNDKRAVTISKQPALDDIDAFIYRWNVTYPIDRWWRERHSVAFNSPAHRVVSLLDILIEWREEQLIRRSRDTNERNKARAEQRSFEDEIKEFEKMDLTKLDDK